MSCLRTRPLALLACCGLAGFIAGEALAQGLTPLRVDPVLLGLPPVEKKAPPAKPAEPPPASAERAKAEVKTVDPAAVEARTLKAEGETSAPVAEPTKKPAAVAQPAVSVAPDRSPARVAAPVETSAPTAASPSPAPVQAPISAQSGAPVAGAKPVPTPVAATAGQVSTLAPLRVHPGLLGQPVMASGESRGRSGTAVVAAASVAVPTTLAGLDKAREDTWRAGRPPVLTFPTETLALPEGAVPSPSLKSARMLEPLASSGSLPVPMFLTADDLAGITDHEAVATGNAEARKAGAVVNADRMTYRPVEDELEAVGNVQLAQGNDLVTGPRMRMRMASQTGVFDEPNFFLKREAKWATKEREREEKGAKKNTMPVDGNALAAWNTVAARMSRPDPGSLMNVLGVSSEAPAPLPMTEARGSAERMDFEGENKLRIVNGNYTTCKPGDPGWYVRADELALDYDREVGEGRNGTVYFQNTPIFHSPWLSFSLNNARKSGFLTPTVGSSSASGLTLSAPYYWNIAPNMDATISPRVFSKRGFQMASEFRYLDPHYIGTLRGEVLPSDNQKDGDSRYAYSLRHQQNFGLGLSGTLNVSGVSDDDYFTNLSHRSVLTSQRQLLRQGILTYLAPDSWWSASMVGQSYQTLNPDNTTSQQIEKVYSMAPQINIAARRPDFQGADLAFTGQFTSFVHADANASNPAKRKDEGQRTVAYPQVSLPFVQPGWYVTPKAGLHMTNYSLDRNAPGSSGPNSLTRSLPIYSIDSGMTFERETTWFGAAATQTLEPRLYYLYVPYKNQDLIPNFDSGVADFNFAQIFSENQFSGYDRVADANQLTAAVVSRLIDPTSGAEAMRAMFGQRYYFKQQEATLPGATLQRSQANDKWNRSDFLAAFSGRVLPKTWLDSALQYNPSDQRMERSSIGARYQPELGKTLNAAYRFGSKEAAGGTAFKNVDIAGQWPIWGGWSAVGRYNYSILDHKPVETVGGLEYNAGCWAVRIVGHQVATTTGKSNTSIFFQLELNDFARIGSNPVDLLRRNIAGYGLAGQSVADPIFGE